MATKKLKVIYDAEICQLDKGRYETIEDLFEYPSLKDLYKKAQKIIKTYHKHEYKNGKRFFLRNIERIEFRLIDTAAKEIKVRL